MEKNVTLAVSDEMIREADTLENNPELMLALIDLLFLNEDCGKVIPS